MFSQSDAQLASMIMFPVCFSKVSAVVGYFLSIIPSIPRFGPYREWPKNEQKIDLRRIFLSEAIHLRLGIFFPAPFHQEGWLMMPR